MQSTALHKMNLWLEKRLSYPGCTERQLQGNITVFENQIFLAVFTGIAAIALLIFNPQATIFMQYLIAFSSLYVFSLMMQLLFPGRFMVTQICINLMMHLLTFYYVIQLGGIPTSGGIIFAGISNVIATIPRQRTWLPIFIFAVFSVWVVLLLFLKPWLHVPDQMTPGLNSLFWMISSIILTGSALAFVLRFIKQQRKLEELETRHLKEINEIKDRFFTNITHEFRTPLTVIKGMTDLIRIRPGEWMGKGLEKIETNSDTLLRLVNQMLNLAKTEAGTISANFVRGDVNKYLAYQAEQFSSEALRRRIALRFSSSEETFEMDFDPEKMMHILTNLVSNALKYTPEGGVIEIITSSKENGEKFSIQVKDTGIGIEKEHLDHIFDRFYRVEQQLSPGGTGIGLALTKELVQLLNGTISVESVKDSGSLFTVLLPVTRSAPSYDNLDVTDLIKVMDDKSRSINITEEPVNQEQAYKESISVSEIVQAKLPLLLIVEDSSDVVLYLEAILKYEYRIEVAENGSIGFNKALELVPDIILSDVMMPVMDGIEMLDRLKNDIRTSHIPVVMLTAKADIDSRLAGLERGADAYLAKPVDERELHIQLKNLVDLRKRLYERYTSLEKIPETSDKFLKKEDDFMIKVRHALEANLDDDEFAISKLCRIMSVSHAQLYRKFKSLSNITIADYFKSLRLNKAKELLLTTSLNVTEVAYSTGFKSLPYFSREFTRKFGKSPSELRK
jgi:signal transduction histidine kinase/CheY-like chemotaxis protein